MRQIGWGVISIALLLFITSCQSAPESSDVTNSDVATSIAPASNEANPNDHSDCQAEFVPVKEYVAGVIEREVLPGGGLLIIKDDHTYCRVFYGRYTETTTVNLVSAAKWLSAATIMTIVDEGLLALDDPVSKYLDHFQGEHGEITVRQMLSHTSGLPAYTQCMFVQEITLSGCSYEIAGLELEAMPGSEFRYGGVAYSLAGRVAEVAADQFWNDIFRERIAEPLLLSFTDFGATYNPMLSEGYVVSTMDEYARFVKMIKDEGKAFGKQVLSVEAIQEILKEQTTDADLTYSIAGPNTSYGLGVWRNNIDENGFAHHISSPGGGGFVPWIDYQRNVIGIFMINHRIEPVWNDISEIQQMIRDIVDEQFAN